MVNTRIQDAILLLHLFWFRHSGAFTPPADSVLIASLRPILRHHCMLVCYTGCRFTSMYVLRMCLHWLLIGWPNAQIKRAHVIFPPRLRPRHFHSRQLSTSTFHLQYSVTQTPPCLSNVLFVIFHSSFQLRDHGVSRASHSCSMGDAHPYSNIPPWPRKQRARVL